MSIASRVESRPILDPSRDAALNSKEQAGLIETGTKALRLSFPRPRETTDGRARRQAALAAALGSMREMVREAVRRIDSEMSARDPPSVRKDEVADPDPKVEEVKVP
jgi:hypothetical protein